MTTTEIIRETGIKPSTLAYLTREGKLPCERRGKGVPTLYHKESIEIVRKYLVRTGQLNKVVR